MHPAINASDLEVEVRNGVVTLRGTVQDPRSQRLAVDVAESVAGVMDVQSEVDEQNADDLYHRGREAMETGMLDEAAELFRRSIAEWPHFKTLELLGECLLRLDRPREAIVPLAAAATLNAPGRIPRILLARTFLELGDYPDALEQAEEALRRAPGNEDALAVRQTARRHLEGERFG
jgi:tetratricopeptide (TPR) repeat protein